MKKVEALSGQTLLDIVIQELGSLEGMFDVLRANNLKPGDDISAGDKLIIDSEPVDRQRYKYIVQNNITPATAFGTVDELTPDPGLGGIGYWIIETDFEVQ